MSDSFSESSDSDEVRTTKSIFTSTPPPRILGFFVSGEQMGSALPTPSLAVEAGAFGEELLSPAVEAISFTSQPSGGEALALTELTPAAVGTDILHSPRARIDCFSCVILCLLW